MIRGEFSVKWFGSRPESQRYRSKVRVTAQKSELQPRIRTESPRKGTRIGFWCFYRKPPLEPTWIHLRNKRTSHNDMFPPLLWRRLGVVSLRGDGHWPDQLHLGGLQKWDWSVLLMVESPLTKETPWYVIPPPLSVTFLCARPFLTVHLTPQAIFFPKAPAFWDLTPTLFSRGKATWFANPSATHRGQNP